VFWISQAAIGAPMSVSTKLNGSAGYVKVKVFGIKGRIKHSRYWLGYFPKSFGLFG
jgi:hypothetical protein